MSAGVRCNQNYFTLLLVIVISETQWDRVNKWFILATSPHYRPKFSGESVAMMCSDVDYYCCEDRCHFLCNVGH